MTVSVIIPTYNRKLMKTTTREECVVFVESIKTHFTENFPFLKDEDRDNFIDKLNAILHEDEFLVDQINIDNLTKLIRQILATLDNSHVSLSEKNLETFKLTKEIYYKAKTFWIDEGSEPLEIISINDVPIEKLIEEKLKEIGGGTLEWKKYKATNKVMIKDTAEYVIIKAKDAHDNIVEINARFVKNENKRFEIKVENGIAREYRRDDYIEGRILNDDTALINIKSWGGKINIDGKNIAQLVEEELEKIKECKSIIFDVRENDGGNSHYARLVASHFLKDKVDVCNFLIKKPGQKEMIREYTKIGPEGEYYDQRLVVLTGPRCISSTDMFLTFLKDTGRAVAIGQTTGGGSGNPQIFNLHLGDREFDLWVSSWRNYRNNGVEIENNGIEPDIFIEPTLEDVRKHIDVELERAVEYLKKIKNKNNEQY